MITPTAQIDTYMAVYGLEIERGHWVQATQCLYQAKTVAEQNNMPMTAFALGLAIRGHLETFTGSKYPKVEAKDVSEGDS